MTEAMLLHSSLDCAVVQFIAMAFGCLRQSEWQFCRRKKDGSLYTRFEMDHKNRYINGYVNVAEAVESCFHDSALGWASNAFLTLYGLHTNERRTL